MSFNAEPIVSIGMNKLKGDTRPIRRKRNRLVKLLIMRKFMVKEKAKQHYVPQFYLKLFSPNGKSNYVYCYDKETGKSFKTGIRSICREIGFYENEHKSDKSIEDAFSIAERECSNLFSKIVNAEDLSVLNMVELSGLLVQLLLFKQRTKKRRNIVSIARKKWIERIDNKFSDWKVVPKSDNWQQSDHLLSMVETSKDELEKLCKNDWELVINKSKIPLWTSDDPLVQQFVNNDKRFDEPYVKNYFPLTPELLIHSQPLVCSNIRLSKIGIADEKVIGNLNRLTLKNAHRFVISRNDGFS